MTHDADGRPLPYLPWNVAGVAATAICRGTPGGRTPSDEDVAWLCYLYSNLEHPEDSAESGSGIELIARFIYQQWPYQRSGLKEWARPVALFEDTSFLPEYKPEVMKLGWAQELLDCSVRDFTSVGFCLFAAMSNGSTYPFPWEWTVEDILEMHGGVAGFNRIVRRNFVTDITEFKRERKAAVDLLARTPGGRYRREPFAYNPLLSKPLIGGITPEAWLAPCVPTLALRTSSLGVLYAGLAHWGEAFSRDAGHLFERYVGRQLSLVEDVTLVGEIEYRRKGNRLLSVDWLVILPETILLIECKSLIPTRAIREGLDNFLGAHGRLGKALNQINRTAGAIQGRLTEFAGIPSDREMVGLVVTLGNFEMANDPIVRSQLSETVVPTAVLGIDELEALVTMNPSELRTAAVDAPNHVIHGGILEPRRWLADRQGGANAILEAAFDSLPAIKRIAEGKSNA